MLTHDMKTTYCKSKKSATELDMTVEFLKVIAEKNRIQILCMLQSGPKCVCDIWQFLDLPQNLTSHHLKVLKDFGLVEDKKEGLKVYYSINKQAITTYSSLVTTFLQSHEK